MERCPYCRLRMIPFRPRQRPGRERKTCGHADCRAKHKEAMRLRRRQDQRTASAIQRPWEAAGRKPQIEAPTPAPFAPKVFRMNPYSAELRARMEANREALLDGKWAAEIQTDSEPCERSGAAPRQGPRMAQKAVSGRAGRAVGR